MKRVVPPMSLDLAASDLAFAVAATARPRRRGPAARLVEAATGGALAVLSVRTGFDLWLQAMEFPRGSEIAMSAVTLPDMARVAEHHGLVVVPIDIDPATMAPRAADVAAALTPRTRAIVIAHLYGGRVRLGPIAAIAARAGVPLVEDCAQAFAGGDIEAHPGAALSLYSFGSIKTATALGGGLAWVRDRAVRERMHAIAARYPVQSRAAFAQRVLKYAALAAASHPRMYGVAVAAADAAGHDSAALAKRLSRGFTGQDLVSAIRHQPSAPLLSLLHRRLTSASAGRVAARAAVAGWLARMLPRDVEVPGRAAAQPTWWLLPIAVGNPETVHRALRAAGFDASRGTTSLAALAAPADRPQPLRAIELMSAIVYLPVTATSTPAELRAICDVVARVAQPRGRVARRAA